jgi:hypothetical protein
MDIYTVESLRDEEFAKAGNRKVVVEVDYNDVDDLVNRHFPNMRNPYECVAYEEWGNDQDHSMDIDGKLDSDDIKDIHEMMNRGKWKHWRTRALLNYLCSLGVIEPAEYLISVSW